MHKRTFVTPCPSNNPVSLWEAAAGSRGSSNDNPPIGKVNERVSGWLQKEQQRAVGSSATRGATTATTAAAARLLECQLFADHKLQQATI